MAYRCPVASVLLVKKAISQMVKNLPSMQETWVGKIPWRRKWQPTPVLLSGESHGQRSLVGYSLWDHRESDTAERLSTHSNRNLDYWLEPSSLL